MFERALLTPYVNNAIHEENERIRAELREKGPAFDHTSINGRFRQAVAKAEAEEQKNQNEEPRD